MPLQKCYECGNDVSTAAAACPKCGAPPKSVATSAGVAISTVEATSKRLKGQLLVSYFVFIAGLIMMAADYASADPAKPKADSIAVVSGAVTLIGLMMIALTRLRIWWNHA